VLAARRLKLKEVPTIALSHLDEAERRAFMIADNRLAELASWDDVRLGVELKELKTLDLDFALSATGFSLREIDLELEAVEASGGRKPGSPPSSGASRHLARNAYAATIIDMTRLASSGSRSALCGLRSDRTSKTILSIS
jgi:hypothetical protein